MKEHTMENLTMVEQNKEYLHQIQVKAMKECG